MSWSIPSVDQQVARLLVPDDSDPFSLRALAARQREHDVRDAAERYTLWVARGNSSPIFHNNQSPDEGWGDWGAREAWEAIRIGKDKYIVSRKKAREPSE